MAGLFMLNAIAIDFRASEGKPKAMMIFLRNLYELFMPLLCLPYAERASITKSALSDLGQEGIDTGRKVKSCWSNSHLII
jgi:hypothetical protein